MKYTWGERDEYSRQKADEILATLENAVHSTRVNPEQRDILARLIANGVREVILDVTEEARLRHSSGYGRS